jgi:histidyl-tRNA synthetase
MVIARSLRGMNDLFESDLVVWRKIEDALRDIFKAFAYQEIRTPILEELALFKRGIGETSDIVEKEMFLVKDDEHTYCLRPENTAPVVRALIERGGISKEIQEKLYYFGPMFRKERPQKGRLRQFHQFGVELFGISEPLADVEIMVMIDHLFAKLGLSKVKLKINTLGAPEERNTYKIKLREFLSNHIEHVCEDCKRRFTLNPLRILDCKNPGCRKMALRAPKIIELLGRDSRMHFDEVIKGLQNQNIAFELDNFLVRGLDYYNRTVFEFVVDEGLGAQNAVAAGGRYDGLFLTLGNKIDLPAIGCAGGIERIAMLLSNDLLASKIQLSLVSADDKSHQLAAKLCFSLRKMGISVDFSLIKKSLKAQMRRADKLNSIYVAVIGENEVNTKRITIKNLENKITKDLPLDAKSIANFFDANMN